MKSRYLVALVFATLIGCALEPGDGAKPDSKPQPVVTGSITAEMKAARSESATIYRAKLVAIAADIEAGKIVYDTKLQLELSQASRDAAKPIQDVLAKHLPTGPISDTKGAAAKVRQIRDGYQ